MFSSILSAGLLVFTVSFTTVQGQEEMGFDLFEVDEGEGIFIGSYSTSSAMLSGLFSQWCVLGRNGHM